MINLKTPIRSERRKNLIALFRNSLIGAQIVTGGNVLTGMWWNIEIMTGPHTGAHMSLNLERHLTR